MSNHETTVARYIDAWNEADHSRRGSLVASIWTEQGTYADPLMQSEGHASINAMIGAARQHFPGHRFTLQGAPDNHGAHVRFCWVLASENGPPAARGTDFAVLAADGRFSSVTGFLDQVPAA
jgi:hypothetical protein